MTNPDHMQRAKELLAVEWEADGQVMLAGMIRMGHPVATNNEHTQRALRAIAAALSEAQAQENTKVPSGMVMLQVSDAEKLCEMAEKVAQVFEHLPIYRVRDLIAGARGIRNG